MTTTVLPYTGAGAQTIMTADDVVTKLETLRVVLAQLAGYEDGVEGFVDGIEALIGSTNNLLTTQNGYLDQVEALITATNTALTTQNGYLDGVEAKLDAQTALLADPTAAKVDTVVQSAAVDRGLIIGFSGVAAAATTSSTTLTVTVPTSQGVPVVGQVIAGTGITAGTTITAVSGTAPNYSLTLSAVATVANAAAVTGNPGSVSFMALNATRRGWSIFNYSASAIVYVSGLGAATTDYHSLRIKPGEFYDTKDSHVGTTALTIISDTGGALVYAREW